MRQQLTIVIRISYRIFVYVLPALPDSVFLSLIQNLYVPSSLLL